MKVLQICQDYYNTNLYKNLFRELNDLDIKNVIYVPQNINQVKQIYEFNNDIIYSLPCHDKKDTFLFLHKQRKMYDALIKNINLEDIDIINAHTLFSSGNLAYNLKKNYGIKYVVSVRNTDVNYFFKYRINLKNRAIKILLESEKVIFLSPLYREKVINRYVPAKYRSKVREKSVVIPNGIENIWFDSNQSKEKIINKKKMKLIQVSKLDKNKNLGQTIRLLQNMRRDKYDIEFNIVGDGPLKKLITDKQTSIDGIHYHGLLEKDKIIELYKKNDIFVMPSRYETFGLVYIEAMSQGVPVIYTRGQGIDGYFDEGEVGYSVEYNNVKEMREKILKIYEDYNSISNRCVEKSKTFNWNNVSKKYFDIYNTVY